jgi:hypothetical protein
MHLRVLLALLPAAVVAAPTITTASCDKAALASGADAYVASLTAGKLDSLQKLSSTSNFSYVENNQAIDVSKSTVLGAQALKVDHRRTNYDLVQCASYSEIISSTGPKPYVIGTMVRHDPSTMAIIVVDSIISTTGAWLFDAAKTLSYVKNETWDILPEAKRSSRAALQAAGDAYLDMWSNATAQNAVPWGTPCTRLEGSAYTGKGQPDDSCKPGIPSNHSQAPNIRRRYVIDEEMGSATIFCVWQHMMNAADSHEFRLESGKLRYVHTMTVCPGQTCKL